jgi:hypothetical protein
MEEHKYLPPKYSWAFKDLADFFGISEGSNKDPSLSRHTRTISTNDSNKSLVRPQIYQQDFQFQWWISKGWLELAYNYQTKESRSYEYSRRQ